uniref:Uncharacterized protein n=1 Tax=Glossina austeni TaxID=7395 RepID=A0A1A9VT48_GLOAU
MATTFLPSIFCKTLCYTPAEKRRYNNDALSENANDVAGELQECVLLTKAYGCCDHIHESSALVRQCGWVWGGQQRAYNVIIRPGTDGDSVGASGSDDGVDEYGVDEDSVDDDVQASGNVAFDIGDMYSDTSSRYDGFCLAFLIASRDLVEKKGTSTLFMNRVLPAIRDVYILCYILKVWIYPYNIIKQEYQKIVSGTDGLNSSEEKAAAMLTDGVGNFTEVFDFILNSAFAEAN